MATEYERGFMDAKARAAKVAFRYAASAQNAQEAHYRHTDKPFSFRDYGFNHQLITWSQSIGCEIDSLDPNSEY